MSSTWETNRHRYEAILGGPVPGLDAAEFAPLADLADTLDALGAASRRNMPQVELTASILSRAQALPENAYHAPAPIDDALLAAYLDDALAPQATADVERALSEWPEQQRELSALIDLRARLETLGEQIAAQAEEVDMTSDILARAAEAAFTETYDDLESRRLAHDLEKLGDAMAAAAPEIDVLGDVLARVREERPAAVPVNVVPLRPATRRKSGSDGRLGWSAAAAAILLVLAGFMLVRYNDAHRVEQRRIARPASQSHTELDALQQSAPAAERVASGEMDVAAPDSGAEERPMLARKKSTTWSDVLNAKRAALLDNENARAAQDLLSKWGSLTPEEILDILEQDGLTPELLAGAAQYLPPDEAAALLRDLVAKYPEDPYLRYSLAQNLSASGNVEEAQAHLAEWARLEPDNGLPSYMEANLRFANGDVEGGIEALQRASAAPYTYSYSVDSALNREQALIASGMDRDAARFLAATSAGDREYHNLRDLGESFQEYGDGYMNAGDFDSAEQIYLSMVDLGQQLRSGAQTTSDMTAAIELQRSGLGALQGLYQIFGVSNPELLTQLTAQLYQDVNQLTAMLEQINSTLNSANLGAINELLSLILQGAGVTFFTN